MSTAAASPFISVPELISSLEGTHPPIVVFVAADAAPPGALVPGSVTSQVGAQFAGPGGGERGRLPLPEKSAVQRWLGEAGIGPASDVVVYDAGSGGQAARAWWVLNWAGQSRVRILDGGLAAWLRHSGHPSRAQPRQEGAGRAEAAAAPFQAIDTRQILEDPSAYRLVDARGRSAFEGDGRQPSHLPGAISSPAAQWQDENGQLLPLAARRAQAEALGLLGADRPVVAYCGAGIAAAYLIAATQDLGVDAALYAGSWSAWSADPKRLQASGPPC